MPLEEFKQVMRYVLQDSRLSKILVVYVFGLVGVSGWFGVMDWGEADLKFLRSLKPWRWPYATGGSVVLRVRVFGRWSGAMLACLLAMYIVIGLLSFTNNSDRVLFNPRGQRTHERKHKGVFSHYHVESIPSRNKLAVRMLSADADGATDAAPQTARPARNING